MHGFARMIGYTFLASGGMMMAFPESTRRMIQIRAEFAQLSPGALRMLGGVYFLIGGLLVSVTETPAVEVGAGKSEPSEIRRAA